MLSTTHPPTYQDSARMVMDFSNAIQARGDAHIKAQVDDFARRVQHHSAIVVEGGSRDVVGELQRKLRGPT